MKFGTHNTLDGVAEGTPFADVICFTEAISAKLRAELSETHRLHVCTWQRDLVIAVNRRLETEDVKYHYRLVHPGIPKVTPHRGVFWITLRIGGVRYAIVCEHRINAAFPPFRRGERLYRPLMWKRHTRIALRIIRRMLKRGRKVLAGGDLNTPERVDGYQGVLHEVGEHFDRLGSDGPLTDVEVLGTGGSDHHRLRAEAA